jgi:hypothetical protein
LQWADVLSAEHRLIEAVQSIDSAYAYPPDMYLPTTGLEQIGIRPPTLAEDALTHLKETSTTNHPSL